MTGFPSLLPRPQTAIELGWLLALAVVGGALAGLGKATSRSAALAGLMVVGPVMLLVLARCHVWQPVLATSLVPLVAALTAACQACWQALRTTPAAPLPAPPPPQSTPKASARPQSPRQTPRRKRSR